MALEKRAELSAITVRDVTTELRFLEFEFDAVGGGPVVVTLPRSLRNRQIYDRLRDAGLPSSISEECVGLICAKADDIVKAHTTQTGWQADFSFITPVETIGGSVCYAGERAEWHTSAGDLRFWKAGLRQPCKVSPQLAFAIGAAFAAPLLKFLELPESAVFHFFGESSAGKSLCARAAQSVYCRALTDDLPTFDASRTGTEDFVAAHNDMVVIFDEVGRSGSETSVLSEIAYKIPSGRGTERGTHAQKNGFPRRRWRTICLTTGEKAPALKLNGEKARLVGIAVRPPSEGGIFSANSENLNNLIDITAATIRSCHGVAIGPYVQYLAKDPDRTGKIATRLAKTFVKRVTGRRANSWERRYAMKFGLVYAGMHLAAEAGVAPWAASEIDVQAVYESARAELAHPTELASTIRAEIKRLCESGTALPTINEGERVSVEVVESLIGFQRYDAQHGLLVMLKMPWLADRCGNKPTAKAVLKELVKSKTLLSGSNGKSTRQIALLGYGKRARWLALKFSKL